MPLQLFENVGSAGILADTSPRKLPDGAWSDGRNVRFDGFTARKVNGARVVQGSLSASPYSIFAHTTFDGAQFFAYPGLTRVFTVNNNLHYDLTRTLVSGTAVLYNTDDTQLWTGGVLGGLLFLNNGVDVPQIQLTPTASCRLSDLPAWPTTITTRASCMRAYKNYLVALDVTKGPIRYRQMVKWSSSADPLTAPATWNEADTTNDAGETSLSETNGTVIDCLPMRDINIIYKDDSVHGMQFTGGQFIFRFYQIFNGTGILAKRCVAAFEQYHCFVGNDLDIYVHDGNSIRSIAQDKWRTWLRQNVDGSRFERMFVVANPVTSEIWICLPTGEEQYTSKVLMWNWRKDTWGVRDLANVSAGAVGGIESSDYITVWDSLTDTWDSWGVTWGELDSLPPDKKLVLVSPTRTTGLIETEFGSSEFGAALPFALERQGIWTLPSKIKDGARIVDLQSVKFVRRVRFRTVEQSSSNNITYMVAVQTDVDSPLVWVSTGKMTGTTAEVTVFKRGRFLSVRAESSADTVFALHSLEVDYEPSGDYL
jgi:hypothetical protein